MKLFTGGPAWRCISATTALGVDATAEERTGGASVRHPQRHGIVEHAPDLAGQLVLGGIRAPAGPSCHQGSRRTVPAPATRRCPGGSSRMSSNIVTPAPVWANARKFVSARMSTRRPMVWSARIALISEANTRPAPSAR